MCSNPAHVSPLRDGGDEEVGALREALAAIEGLSDAEVARQLAGDGSDEAK